MGIRAAHGASGGTRPTSITAVGYQAQRIRAVDASTLVLHTEKAVAPTFLYYCLAAVVGSIVDSKLVKANARGDDFGNDWLKTHSAGSGAFNLAYVQSFLPLTTSREIRANYWAKWFVHRVARPEAVGGLIHNHLVNGVDYPIHEDALRSEAADTALGSPTVEKTGATLIGRCGCQRDRIRP